MPSTISPTSINIITDKIPVYFRDKQPSIVSCGHIRSVPRKFLNFASEHHCRLITGNLTLLGLGGGQNSPWLGFPL